MYKSVIISDLKGFSFQRVAKDLSKVLKIPYMDWREGVVSDSKNIIIVGASYYTTLNYAVKYIGKANIILYLTIEGNPYIDTALKNTLNKYTYIIPVSKYVKSKLEEAGLKPEEPIPHGVEINNKYDPHLYKIIMEEAKGKQIILNISRNDVRKALDRLLLIYKFINHMFPDTFLILHSDTSGVYDIVEISRQLQLRDFWFTALKERNIRLTDEQINTLYKSSYIYLNTSRSEGYGLPILEAMAHGIPIVSPGIPPIAELIGNSKAGLLTSIYNPEYKKYLNYLEFELYDYDIGDLIDATVSILINPKLREEMSREAFEKAKKYDINIVYQSFKGYLK